MRFKKKAKYKVMFFTAESSLLILTVFLKLTIVEKRIQVGNFFFKTAVGVFLEIRSLKVLARIKYILKDKFP